MESGVCDSWQGISLSRQTWLLGTWIEDAVLITNPWFAFTVTKAKKVVYWTLYHLVYRLVTVHRRWFGYGAYVTECLIISGCAQSGAIHDPSCSLLEQQRCHLIETWQSLKSLCLCLLLWLRLHYKPLCNSDFVFAQIGFTFDLDGYGSHLLI